MNRGVRREINKRKWINKLKQLYNSHSFDYCCRKVKQPRYQVQNYFKWEKQYDNWQELTNDIWGVLHKHTRTLYRDNKWLDIKDERKRNLNNRKLRKEDIEDIDNYIEDSNDIFSFEKYCGSCDYFNNEEECPFYNDVNENTKWKHKCNKYWN